MATTMDNTHPPMLLGRPGAFVFLLVNSPVGLVIYWVTTNLWTVGQGLITRRLMPKAQPPPKRSSRTPPREEPAAEEPAPAPAPAAAPSQPRRVKRKKKKARR